MHGGDYQVDPDGYEGRMTKGNLFKIAEYAQSLHDLIGDDENLEPWVEEKIAVAAHMMDSVGHYLQYEKHRGHEESESEEDEYIEISSGHEDEDAVGEETEFEEGYEE